MHEYLIVRVILLDSSKITLTIQARETDANIYCKIYVQVFKQETMELVHNSASHSATYVTF